MSEQYDAPKWHYFSEAARNWAIVFGALALFFLYGCPRERLDLKIKEVDSKLREADQRIVQATEDARVRLGEYEARAKKAEAILSETQASVAELDVKRRTTPSLLVKPVVDQWPSADDVREIRLELQFSNDADEVVTVRDISVTVFRGSTSREVYDAILQTQNFAKAKQIRSQSYGPLSPPIEGNDFEARRQRWAQEIIDAHNKQEQCSHGQVFLISGESDHVEWEELQQAAKIRKANHTLAPGESVTEQFYYVLTEAQSLHWNWFRFHVVVNKDSASERVIEFNLPGLRVEGQGAGRPTAATVQETSYRTFRWEPRSPLLPVPKAGETSKGEE